MKPHSARSMSGRLFDGASSSQASRVIELPDPCSKFSLQVLAATSSAQVTLFGGLAPATSALTSVLIAYTSASAAVASTASTGPYTHVYAQLVQPGSSGGTSAWFAAGP